MTSVVDPDRHPGLADPDPYPFQPNVKLNYVQNNRTLTPVTLPKKLNNVR